LKAIGNIFGFYPAAPLDGVADVSVNVRAANFLPPPFPGAGWRGAGGSGSKTDRVVAAVFDGEVGGLRIGVGIGAGVAPSPKEKLNIR